MKRNRNNRISQAEKCVNNVHRDKSGKKNTRMTQRERTKGRQISACKNCHSYVCTCVRERELDQSWFMFQRKSTCIFCIQSNCGAGRDTNLWASDGPGAPAPAASARCAACSPSRSLWSTWSPPAEGSPSCRSAKSWTRKPDGSAPPRLSGGERRGRDGDKKKKTEKKRCYTCLWVSSHVCLT